MAFLGKLRWWVFFCGLFSFTSLAGEDSGKADFEAQLAAITQALAADSMEGRGLATDGHEQALRFLEAWLLEHEFQPLGDEKGSFRQRFARGTNLIAVVYPKGQEGKRPTVLVSAHYDHLASGCVGDAQAESPTCNGATDNAAGVAAVLVAALLFKDRIESPVAVALWDGEEEGRLGSLAFVKKPTFPLRFLKVVVNLDIIGLNLFEGMADYHFAMGCETGGPALVDHVEKAAARAGLVLETFSYAFGHLRSDHTSFTTAPSGGIPSVFFTDGDGAQYHSSRDESSQVNFAKAGQVSRMTAELVVAASQNETSYTFVDPPKTEGQFAPGLQ